MGVLKKVMRSFILLVLLVIVLYFISNSITNHTGFMVKEVNTNFEKCLKEKEVKLYVDDYDLMKLKELKAGKYLGSVKVSSCMLDRINCLREGITEYPTWVIDGEKYRGDIDVFRLSDLTGCEMV